MRRRLSCVISLWELNPKRNEFSECTGVKAEGRVPPDEKKTPYRKSPLL